MAQRQDQDTRTTLCGGAQTQTDAKNAPQTGLIASKSISLVIHSDFSAGVGQVVISLNVNKRIDEEMEIVGVELFSSKSQASFNEGQPQPLARQIWPHTQANSNSLVLAVDAWIAAIPYQGRGAEIKETNQLATLVPHCIVGTAPVKFFREVFGVLRRVVDSVRLIIAPGPDGACLNLVHELERELHCKYPPVLLYHAAAPAGYCT